MNSAPPAWLAILIALFTVVGGALFAWRNSKSTRKAAAFTAFRDLVLEELKDVYPKPVNWPSKVDPFFKSHFTTLQAAVGKIRPFVDDKPGFDGAWVRYYNAYPTRTKEQCYHHYMGAHDPFDGTQAMADAKCRAELHKNVSSLLAFTNET